LGRAVIAMTAVRIDARVEPGKVTDLTSIRPPTDVMAITSLPYALTRHLHPGLPPENAPPVASERLFP
jgi:hypothetical protein